MLDDLIEEATRQVQICNACRYCEGYCAVFPAIHREREFTPAKVTQLANLCHNCRGCYYACQYTEPHEFAVNVPKALAEVREASWQEFAVPQRFAHYFHRSALSITLTCVAGFGLFIFLMIQLGQQSDGLAFYRWLSHGAMISVFIPAFIMPLLAISISLRNYWASVGGTALRWTHIRYALQAAAGMRNLKGGHGEGCNFESADRFSHSRRIMHQLTLYGFLLCFAATTSATFMHYFLQMPAPYALFSVPKLFGLSGGVMLCVGTAGLAWLKRKADRTLAANVNDSGAYGFILLLFMVSASGLLLYATADLAVGRLVLAWHLGCVLSLFLLMPYSKMAHGFYRMAALMRESQQHG